MANNLQNLENEIRSKLPHLMELSAGCEIFIPKDFSQEIYSYTIVKMFHSNSYLDNKKTWEGLKTHDNPELVVLVINNAIAYETERYAVKDCIFKGKPITLPDVLRWLRGLRNSLGFEIDEMYEKDLLDNWNLEKYNIDDQPQPVKDLLFNLIEKK